MSTELTEHKGGEIISAISQQGIAEMLKPLIDEIHLFDTYVAGTSHLKDKTVLEEIKVDDRLNLMREDNKFDDNAILVLTENGKKLGYVPEKDNVIFARLMDAGKRLVGKIKKIDDVSGFMKINIGIFLVDF